MLSVFIRLEEDTAVCFLELGLKEYLYEMMGLFPR